MAAIGRRVSSARRVDGRNRVHAVASGADDEPAWFLKQFGPDDHDGQAFEHEREFCERHPNLPVLAPDHVDAAWRVLLFPAVGRSLYSMLSEGDGLPAGVGGMVRLGLNKVHSAAVDASDAAPPLLSWFAGDTLSAPLAPAQLRLLTVLRAEPQVANSAKAAIEVWRDAEAATLHGDLKLEHIIVPSGTPGDDVASVLWFVDWEFSRSGPLEWDYAGLAQSLLALAALGFVDWSASVIEFLHGCLADIDVGSDEFALFVALRLWQTAIECETHRTQLSRQAGPLCQLAIRLVEKPARIRHLMGA